MQRVYRAVFFGILASLCVVAPAGWQPVHATGNVLLPDSYKNDTSGGSANLGLAPSAPASKSYLIPQTDTTTPDTPDAAKTTVPPTTLPYTGAAPALSDPGLPKNLAVGIADKSMWNANDITSVSGKLGIAADKVSSLCHLSISGYLKTDKSIYFIDTGIGGSADVGYDGNASVIMLSYKALCDPLPMSPKGFVMQVDGKYSVPLQGVSCKVTIPSPKNLTISFAGNGPPQCNLR